FSCIIDSACVCVDVSSVIFVDVRLFSAVPLRPLTCVVDRFEAVNASSEGVETALICVVVSPCARGVVSDPSCVAVKLSNVDVANAPSCVAVSAAPCVVLTP